MNQPRVFVLMLAAACGGGAAPCPVMSVFRGWRVAAFEASSTGATALDPLSLIGGHYGTGNKLAISDGCSYDLAITKTATGDGSEAGDFDVSNAYPWQPVCKARMGKAQYALACDTLTVSGAFGTATYTSPAPH